MEFVGERPTWTKRSAKDAWETRAGDARDADRAASNDGDKTAGKKTVYVNTHHSGDVAYLEELEQPMKIITETVRKPGWIKGQTTKGGGLMTQERIEGGLREKDGGQTRYWCMHALNFDEIQVILRCTCLYI